MANASEFFIRPLAQGSQRCEAKMMYLLVSLLILSASLLHGEDSNVTKVSSTEEALITEDFEEVNSERAEIEALEAENDGNKKRGLGFVAVVVAGLLLLVAAIIVVVIFVANRDRSENLREPNYYIFEILKVAIQLHKLIFSINFLEENIDIEKENSKKSSTPIRPIKNLPEDKEGEEEKEDLSDDNPVSTKSKFSYFEVMKRLRRQEHHGVESEKVKSPSTDSLKTVVRGELNPISSPSESPAEPTSPTAQLEETISPTTSPTPTSPTTPSPSTEPTETISPTTPPPPSAKPSVSASPTSPTTHQPSIEPSYSPLKRTSTGPFPPLPEESEEEFTLTPSSPVPPPKPPPPGKKPPEPRGPTTVTKFSGSNYIYHA